MRQALAHLLEVGRVLPLLVEDLREAAAQVPELVAHGRARHLPAHPPLPVDRAFDLVAQAADAPGEPRCEHPERERPHQAHGEDGREQLLEGAVAHGQHVVGRLLHEHGAPHLVLHVDRVRGREHDRPRVGGEAPAGALAPGEGAHRLAPLEPIGSGLDVLEVLARLAQEDAGERANPGLGEAVPGGRLRQRSRRRPAQGARVGEYTAIHVDHPDPRLRAPETADEVADLRRGHEHRAQLLARPGASGADLADEGACLRVVHVHDREGEAGPDERAGQTQLDEVAFGARAPDPGKPVVGQARPHVGHQPRRHRPVAARIHRKAQELVVRGHDRDLHVVAGREVGPVRIGEHDLVVPHLQERVDPGPVPADPVAEGEGSARSLVAPRLHRLLLPVSGPSVHHDRPGQAAHAQVAVGTHGHRIHLAREQHVRTVVERRGHRPRRGHEPLLLRVEEQPLQLAHVLQAQPGDEE